MENLSYDYQERKHKLIEILDNTNEIKKVPKLPRDEDFTYNNGYISDVAAIFVDLRDSTKLFSDYDSLEVSKVIRGFTSEIIEMLKSEVEGEELKEIGIRGDCVYAIYSILFDSDFYEISNRAFHINTYMRMLNNLLSERNLPEINAGIGLSTGEILAVKAGRKSSGINNLVWIGKAVSEAANLSSMGYKEVNNPIVMSEEFYKKSIQFVRNNNKDKNVDSWYKEDFDDSIGTFYHAFIIKQEFYDWILNGMKSD